MFLDLHNLPNDLPKVEEIEKSSMRLVTQAILDFREEAAVIFANETDLAQDFGEDITREALDRLGASKIEQRLFGKIDYKRVRYIFHPDYAVKQALFIDSKAEKGDSRTATLQTAQTSMRIRLVRAGAILDNSGGLPVIIQTPKGELLTTTIFVKYHYEVKSGKNNLLKIIIAAVPNGMLQERYNSSADDTIWLAGRDAPSLGEVFRVRLNFEKMQAKSPWRVQTIPMMPASFAWNE